MNTEITIDNAVAHAAAEANRQLPADTPLETGDTVVIAGDGGVLDSLGLLGFLVAVEQRIETETGQSLGLVGADLTRPDPARGEAPLATIGSFKRYLTVRLEAV